MVSGECLILGGWDCYSMGIQPSNGIFMLRISFEQHNQADFPVLLLEGTKYLSLGAGWMLMLANDIPVFAGYMAIVADVSSLCLTIFRLHLASS